MSRSDSESSSDDENDYEEISFEPVIQQQIELRRHQVEHFGRVTDLLRWFYFYMDGSKGGTGKTIIAGAAALRGNLPIIVICPATVKSQWRTFIRTYNIPVVRLPTFPPDDTNTGDQTNKEEEGGMAIFSYGALRSRKNCQPKHGLLTRSERNRITVFESTPLWRDLVRRGVLLIFDECQRTKNLSAQNKACRALVQTIYDQRGGSRIGLLSGTPIDKEEQVIYLCRMLGMITSRNLYSKVQGKIRPEGVAELQQWARQINREAAETFIRTQPFIGTKDGSTNYIYRLFIEVIRPKVMSIMPNPLESQKDIANGYYHLEPEDEEEYNLSIQELTRATKYNPENNYVDGSDVGSITPALRRIQRSKVNAAIRVARTKLEEPFFSLSTGEPGRWKVIIFASYYEVIDRLLIGLADYNPVELTGRISEKQREYNVNLFQELSTRCMVLVGNPVVGGVGLNLHDTTKNGTLPRAMYLLLDYRANEAVQTLDRTTRDGLSGKSYVRIFYGITGATESSIINAFIDKGKIMREMTHEQTLSGAIFPDQFEDEYELSPL